jgi:hypothetical protein
VIKGSLWGLTWGKVLWERCVCGGTGSLPFPVVLRTIWHGSGVTSSSRTLGRRGYEVRWAGQSAVGGSCWSPTVVVLIQQWPFHR